MAIQCQYDLEAHLGHIMYRLLYGRSVPLGHICTGVAISTRGPIWLSSANMT